MFLRGIEYLPEAEEDRQANRVVTCGGDLFCCIGDGLSIRMELEGISRLGRTMCNCCQDGTRFNSRWWRQPDPLTLTWRRCSRQKILKFQ
jgi:hypothetical protein